MFQALKTNCLILFWSWENSLFPLLALWGNRNWLPSMKVKQLEICFNKIGLKRCKWSSLNVPSTESWYPAPYLNQVKTQMVAALLRRCGMERLTDRRLGLGLAGFREIIQNFPTFRDCPACATRSGSRKFEVLRSQR